MPASLGTASPVAPYKIGTIDYDDNSAAAKKEKPKESQCRAVTFGVLGTVHKIADQLKGLQAAAKLARSVETVMKSINGGATGAAAGFSNLLKGFSAASVLLSALNALVTLPEQISKAKEIYNIFKKAVQGNTEGLTLKNLLSQSGFWLKKLAEYIECATFLGNNLSFYQMGAAGQNLPIVKSFADGISSIITIAQKAWDISDAITARSKADANISKWKGRLNWLKSDIARTDGFGWSYERVSHAARKECLKAHLRFLTDAINLGVESKVPQDLLNPLERDRENVKTTLFRKKITKLIKERNLPTGTADRHAYIKNALSKIEKKLWISGLAPESRQAILNVLHDRNLSPEQKVQKLQKMHELVCLLKNLPVFNFGTYSIKNRHAGDFARQIFGSGLYPLPEKSDKANFESLEAACIAHNDTWSAFKNNDWKKFRDSQNDPKFKNTDAFDDPEAFREMRNFCSAKIKQWENMKTKQQNIIARSSMSIAFSIGIIALVALGLTLSLSKGSLPPGIVKSIPYALAGIGVAVSIIGLARFIVDEVKKDKPFDKAKVVHFTPMKRENFDIEGDISEKASVIQRRLDKMEENRDKRLAKRQEFAKAIAKGESIDFPAGVMPKIIQNFAAAASA